MSGPGPHIEDTEPVPAEQRQARPRVEIPPYRSPAQRVRRAADELVAVVRSEVEVGSASESLIWALAEFDRKVREAGA